MNTNYIWILWNHYKSWDSNFSSFRGPLKPQKNKIQRNTIFSLIFACNIWNHEFKNPWINALCRNHGNCCKWQKYFHSSIIIFVVNILWSMSLQIYYKSAKSKLWYAKMASSATKSTSLITENALISIVYHLISW